MAQEHLPANDDYFNDLSRQPNLHPQDAENTSNRSEPNANREEGGLPKQKRVACVICRKRKLKCDGCRPSCGTCSRLGHNCAYDEVRRKSGPKRGYVKELEARLAQVETQLKTKDTGSPPATENNTIPTSTTQNGAPYVAFDSGVMNVDMSAPMDGLLNTGNFEASPPANNIPDIDFAIDENFSWEMIGLGLEEPLPSQEAIDELTQVYFDKIHPAIPIIHKYRYFAGMNLSPHMRPLVCLRYAMWCMAASVSDTFSGHQDILYRRARKYAELDEMRGQGEGIVSVGHSQTWSILSMYEFKMMYFPRAWMSVARACRLSLMMGLNRMDGVGIDVKQCLLPPKDWTEREERRRAFWMAYCCDRFASVGTGWPMITDERDIMTNLPASEEAYQTSTPHSTMSLTACMTPQGAMSISSFAGVVFIAHFFGKNLHHLHRPGPDEREDDLQGEFWKRHRNLDNILLQKSLSLPPHLRLPSAIRDCSAIFINMAIHTSTITLHQAAIFKAEKNDLSATLIEQSQTRCTLAATEITNILKLISHLDTDSMHPYLPFCLYVAARVFVQFLKRVSEDSEIRASLDFLLTAMEWLKRHNPLSESFLIQLKLDIRGSGLDVLLHNPDFTSTKAGCGGVQNVEQLYCALNLEQDQSGNPIRSGGPGLPEPGVCFPEDPKGDILRPAANFGILPAGKGSGSYQGPGGVFPGGWHADHPQPSLRENPSPPSNPTPSNLTPGDSQHASSATSYSPRLEDDRKTPQYDNLAPATTYGNFLPNGQDGMYMGNSSTTNNHDNSSNGSFPMSKDQNTNNDAYAFTPGAWDFSAGTGTTPLSSGISPPLEGHWASANVAPLPNWGNNQRSEDQANVNWKANRRDPPKYGYKSGFLMDTGAPDPNGKDPFQIDFYNDGENTGQNQ